MLCSPVSDHVAEDRLVLLRNSKKKNARNQGCGSGLEDGAKSKTMALCREAVAEPIIDIMAYFYIAYA